MRIEIGESPALSQQPSEKPSLYICLYLLSSISVSLCGSYEVRYTPTKYIDTNEGGLVLLAVNEGDGGRYDSYLDGTLLCSYGVTVDAHRWVSSRIAIEVVGNAID